MSVILFHFLKIVLNGLPQIQIIYSQPWQKSLAVILPSEAGCRYYTFIIGQRKNKKAILFIQ